LKVLFQSLDLALAFYSSKDSAENIFGSKIAQQVLDRKYQSFLSSIEKLFFKDFGTSLQQFQGNT